VAVETAQPTVLSFITHKKAQIFSFFLKKIFLKENVYNILQENKSLLLQPI
jgi:hypothetical protein